MAWKAYYKSYRDDSVNAIYVDIEFSEPVTGRRYTRALHYLPETLTTLQVFKDNVAAEVTSLNRFDAARRFLDDLPVDTEVKNIVVG